MEILPHENFLPCAWRENRSARSSARGRGRGLLEPDELEYHRAHGNRVRQFCQFNDGYGRAAA
jgi:hypothetical protein